MINLFLLWHTELLIDEFIYLSFIKVFYPHTVHSGAQLARPAGLIWNKTNKQINKQTANRLW